MKKVVIFNRVESYEKSKGCKLGCSLFAVKDDYKIEQSRKQFFEKTLSEKFNSISSQGFQFEDGKVLSHNLFVENVLQEDTGKHGVYRFQQSNNSSYKIYFGPLIVAKKKLGCGSRLGCKGISFKGGIGCSSKGGDNEQELNFYNDELNEKHVSKLNSYFGLRKIFSREEHDYTYINDLGTTPLNEFVKDFYEEIRAQFENDVNQIYSNGLNFDTLIDLPSYENKYTQGLLFSTNGTFKIELPDFNNQVSPFKLFLSRFDLWYFPKVKGIIAQILDFIKRLLGFNSSKDDNIEGTDIIEDSNLEKLTTIYENDFNSQLEAEKIHKQKVDKFTEQFLSEVPVTLAFPLKRTWGDFFTGRRRYTFHTFSAHGVKA